MRWTAAALLVMIAPTAALAGSSPTMKAWPEVPLACARLEKRAQEQRVRWRVVCPVVVPRVRLPNLDYAGGESSATSLREGYGFGASSLWAGNGYGHWTFDSGPLRTLLHGLFDINAVGKSADDVTGPSPLRIDGLRVSLYRVAPGESGYADHVAMVWQVGKQAFMVTVHRWDGDRLAVLQARAITGSLIRQLPHQ